ncbi:MAG: PSD1 and planctomycete cytochrome C domain-containing protein [Gemmataceae bacterium]
MPLRPLLVALLLAGPAAASDPASAEFFETKVRPVLVEHCYKCHSSQSKEPKGGLRVDGRDHLLAGGDTGPSLVPGKPAASKLIEAVWYGNPDLLMPPKGKLSPNVAADLEKWVAAGAPWPGDQTAAAKKAGFDLTARRATHWCWQPVTPHAPPAVKNAGWPRDPADAFLLAKLEAAGLAPAPNADPLTWLRRVTFALTGLPPTPAEVDAFSAVLLPPSAFEKVVDRLLASPAFGERWGRHWLDLVRYAETHGHEFDPDIPHAWRYRDYVVRALNADVPYDRFVREHLAGDVLPTPRLDPATGANESIVGTGFWLLSEELHSPVDLRQDQADRFDNRIDVFGKAFLGLTIACARCHDHKFDAITAKDYAALFGVLQGSGYRQARLDGWAQNRAVAAELAGLRSRDRKGAAEPGGERLPLQPLLSSRGSSPGLTVVDYANLKPGEWLPDDVTFGDGPRPAGAMSVRKVGDKFQVRREERTAAVFDRFWSGLKTSPDTVVDYGEFGKRTRAGFTVRTPLFTLERDALYYLVRGGGTAYAGVCGHTLIAGPLHGKLLLSFPAADGYRWVKHALPGYKGQRLHVELTADPRTDFAVAAVVQSDEPPPAPPAGPGWVDAPAELVPELARLHAKEQELAKRVVWESRLAPALFDGPGIDERVFVRGNPRTPGEVVPRRSLEALAGPDPLPIARGSGRLELADQLTDPARNPLLARVAVNRVWHHLFGRGLVATPDNFGALGEAPSHPELLDHLATTFVADGWSLKRLVRRLVLSRAFGMASAGTDPKAATADPGNALLHTFRVKRLEGEAIRDAILQCSGRLDRTLGGPSVPVHLTPFLDGRGRPSASGPLDGNGRRSLYLATRRNFLSPFLQTFDAPIPFSTVGRRQVSNVPAQALTLLNDPFVHQQAEVWGTRLATTDGDRVGALYRAAVGRPPTPAEVEACREFVAGRDRDPAAWAALAHATFNLKEFVFVP